MATRQITTFAGVYHYRQRVKLDGTFYRIEIHWNPRARLHAMGLYTSAGAPLIRSIFLTLGDHLLRAYGPAPGLPPGKFHVRDTHGRNTEAGPDELGARVLLLYEEVAA